MTTSPSPPDRDPAADQQPFPGAPEYHQLQLAQRAVAIAVLVAGGVQILLTDALPIAAFLGANIVFVLSIPGPQYGFITTRLTLSLSALTCLLALTAWWRDRLGPLEATCAVAAFGFLGHMALRAIRARRRAIADQ